MSVGINDLSYDLLKYILNFLEDRQLFVVERVSRKWQKSVLKLLAQKKTLKKLNDYSEKFAQSFSFMNLINNNNIVILKNILSKCPNIKHLDLSNTRVTDNNSLIEIAKLCTKLESIDFKCSEINVSEDEMNEFGKIIGPQLIKCNLRWINRDFFMIFFKHLKNIEDISFNAFQNEQIKELVHHLNIESKNLKVWFCPFEKFDHKDEDMTNVIQRVEHLKIYLSILLRFKVDLVNLTELTIYNFYNEDSIKTEMTFVNVTKLNIQGFHDFQFDLISKFKFPKLESVLIEQHDDIPISFIYQIKNIKSLNCNRISPEILQLRQLTKIVLKTIISCYDDEFFKYLIKSFDVLSQHKSLQNIKIEIEDPNMYIDEIDIFYHFYEKIISFYRAKQNSRIVIKIYQHKIGQNEFKEFKKLFEETKQKLHKVNMELMIC